MANTYSQLYVQLIFAVKHRNSLITPDIKSRVEKFITSMVQNNKCKVFAIYCNPDHTHLFISMKPDVSCSSLVQKIKSSTSLFINRNQLTMSHFEWQTGFGAFSYSKSQTQAVCNYIHKQEIHHQKQSFKDEYLKTLDVFDVDFDECYVFDWLF